MGKTMLENMLSQSLTVQTIEETEMRWIASQIETNKKMVFRNEYYFLSNMYPCNINLKMRDDDIYTFKCAEAAYQAMKTNKSEEIKNLSEMNGYQAKKYGRQIEIVPNLQYLKEHRLEWMKYIVKNKFVQNPELAEKLVNIKTKIEENNTWHDTFWGIYNGKGENYLGLILTEVKNELSFKLTKEVSPKSQPKESGT